MDNAAFDDPQELPKLIRQVARLVADGQADGPVIDVNGNTCGRWQVSESPPG